MTNVLIKRELLEQIDETAICDGTDATISDDLFTQLVAALAAPCQPERDGLEVVASQFPEINFSNYGQDEVEALQTWGFTALDAMADAQRAIAELREECERLRNCLLEVTVRHFSESLKRRSSDKELEQYLSDGIAQLEVERDTLRQQLAERDAELKHARRSIQHMIDQTTPLVPDPDNPGWAKRIQLDDVIAQRDKLAGLLYEASGELRTDRHHGLGPRIYAVLDEVDKKS